MSDYIMAIDQGTTSTRVCLITKDGRLAAQASEPFPQIFPEAGVWSTTPKPFGQPP